MLKWVARKASELKQNAHGATAIEYGLIASLIAIAVIAGAGAVGNTLSNSFNYINSQIKTS